MRWFVGLPLAAVVVVAAADPAAGLVIAQKAPVQRAVTADVVVVGTVTAIEPDPVEALPFPGAPNAVAFRVAVVRIDTPLAGADGVTHLKVGFVPPSPKPEPAPAAAANARGPVARPARPFRPGLQLPELKQGQQFLFFLARHPSGRFLAMPPVSPPIDPKADDGKKQLEAVGKALARLADPGAGLNSDKPEVRFETAALLLTKYRAFPDFGGEVDQEPIPAGQSHLILKALAEGDWARFTPDGPNGLQAFYSLGLSDADGWQFPMVPPGQNPNQVIKAAFEQWLAGPGRDYRVKRNVPKRK
jgi:hypothetical protein